MKLVVVASSPCTDACFDSPVMQILFNGILQISLKQHFAYPSCFCQNLYSGSMSGLNRMFLSSMVNWCLLAKRRNPFLFVAVSIWWNACVIDLAGQSISSESSSITSSLTTFSRNSHTSCSEDTSTKPVATARASFWSFSFVTYC